MIKAIITDVDGVIVGKKHGVNFPLPNSNVIKALTDLQKKNIPVVLCTAKFNHAVKEIALQADLRNPHITDGGALIINFLQNKIVKKHIINNNLAKKIVEQALTGGYYTEIYGTNDYYLQKNQIGDFTEKRFRILQKKHIAVDSLLSRIDDLEIIKIMVFVHNQNDKLLVNKLLEPYKEQIHSVWLLHPATLPAENAVITVTGVSKKSASLEVLHSLGISPEDTLGIGDTEGDWNFMGICKYVGVVGDTSKKLKELAITKGEGNYYFGTSVEEDGFLQIINNFIS